MVTYGDQLARGQPWADKDMMTSLCQLLVRFYEVLASGGTFLSKAHQEEVHTIGQLLADIYTRLARRALDANQKLWKTTPKLHLWLHLTMCCVLNPREFWTYADEDLVGILVDIAETLHPRNLAYNCLYKYLHAHFDDS